MKRWKNPADRGAFYEPQFTDSEGQFMSTYLVEPATALLLSPGDFAPISKFTAAIVGQWKESMRGTDGIKLPFSGAWTRQDPGL